jgi:glucose-6-phosphate 1-dehydrogenase
MGLEAGTGKLPDPCCLVIFGVTGDLAHRLLLPALYNLSVAGLLPKAFAIVGVTRDERGDEALRRDLSEGLQRFATRPLDRDVVRQLFERVSQARADPADARSFESLRQRIEAVEADRGTRGNRLFYLATPPSAFAPIARLLGSAGLIRENGKVWRRLIVEKPFGTDLKSAQALNRELLAIMDEDQIFRMDHFLGKETVQNIMVMRFANGLFEPIWNRHHIDHVQISVAETVHVGRRGQFYDAVGALRDMVPNHLFQLLALVAMDPPASFEANAARSEKAEALNAVRIYSEAQALAASVRGQYKSGRVRGTRVPAYRKEKDVSPESATETYVALKLFIDNWRWAGVPFFLRTGKALSNRKSEVAIKFRQAPIALFRGTPVDHLAQNFLVLRIQPDEGITLQFNAKVPGPAVKIDGVGMTFKYKDYFDSAPSTGYETLIRDCMLGDAILFQRADGVEASWRAVEPFMRAWAKAGNEGLAFYPAGSAGPKEADALIDQDGRRWRSVD